MGDWENIFGAGADIVSLAENINDQWMAERDAELEVERREQIEKLLSFQNSDVVRDLALHHIEEWSDFLDRYEAYPGLCKLLHRRDAKNLQEDLSIPVDLVEIIDEIMLNIEFIYNRMSDFERAKTQGGARELALRLFSGMPKGVDLRYVPHKFMALLARGALNVLQQSNEPLADFCRHGVMITEARARGVWVSDLTAVGVKQAINDRVSEARIERDPYDREAVSATTIARAALARPGSYAQAIACWLDTAKSGDAELYDGYVEFIDILVQLFSTAPTCRLRAIDLGRVESWLAAGRFELQFPVTSYEYLQSGHISPVYLPRLVD